MTSLLQAEHLPCEGAKTRIAKTMRKCRGRGEGALPIRLHIRRYLLQDYFYSNPFGL